MPISKEQEALAKATIERLQSCTTAPAEPVHVTPERMEAFQAMMRMRMNVNVNGHMIVLEEHEDAPESLDEAIEAASGIREATPQLQAGDRCHECGGQTVMLESGDAMCVRCRSVRPKNSQSGVILASERSRMAAMQHAAEKEVAKQSRASLTRKRQH